MGSFITKDAMYCILILIACGLESASDYQNEVEFVAEETYLTYLDYFPSPFREHLLASVNPTLASEWHPTKIIDP